MKKLIILNVALIILSLGLTAQTNPEQKTKDPTDAGKSFVCGNPLIDTRDGQSYATVQIGDQCWMAENLKYLPSVVGPGTGSNTVPYYYVYGYNGTDLNAAKATANYQTYGALYNWPASLNACPEGWHLPSDAEWTALTTYVSSQPEYLCNSNNTSWIAKSLAATTNWSTHTGTCTVGNNLNANNATNFTALPGGLRYTDGSFYSLSNNGTWWSSTEFSSSGAYFPDMNYYVASVGRGGVGKSAGFSVRCLKDETPPPTTYNLNLEVSPTGAGIVTGAGQFEAGEQVNITAEANPGWEFVNWTDEDDTEVSAAPNFVYPMPAEDVTLTANFQEEQIGFTCGLSTITDVDGNIYNTVLIGNQCWMKENLKTTHYRNGTPIEYPGANNSAWQNNTTGAYAWYDNDISWKDSYGALYNWHAVNKANGLCPTGWHVPTDAELTVLTDYLGGTNVAGGKMKSTRTVPDPHPRWESPNTGATNESNWSGLPGGYRNTDGTFYNVGFGGYWWSATEYLAPSVWNRFLSFINGDVSRSYSGDKEGFSVRCLRDETPPPTTYNLNLEVSPTGAGTPTGAGQYEDGEQINITAEANQGWEFINWTDENDTEVSAAPNFVYTMPAEDVTLTANFVEEQVGFTCGDQISDVDGNVYNTVLIGNQCWMKENLKTTNYSNGTPIEYPGSNNTAWQNNTTGAYAWYNNNISWKDSYGALYNWHAVNNANGLCPTGWYIPSDTDWAQLVDYVVAQGFPNDWNNPNGAGNALKSCRQVNSPLGGDCNTTEHPRWESHSTHHGFDEFGFSGLPGGNRYAGGSFYVVGGGGHWWSSTESTTPNAWGRVLYTSSGSVNRNNPTKPHGFSVRCLRDGTAPPPTYNLNLEVSPADAGTVTGEGQYEAGEQINITAEANPGWEFVNWTDNDGIVSEAANFVYTMPAENVTLTVNFIGEHIVELPIVQTAAVGEITQTTAQSGGNITDDGGAPVTARGVVWSASQTPTIETNEGITNDGSGTGSWVSELVELTPATTYYVRAYATNSVGTAYGNQQSFTTLSAPDLELNATGFRILSAEGLEINNSDAGETVFIEVTVFNTGGAATTGDVLVQVFLDGAPTDLESYDVNNYTIAASATITGSIPPGGSSTLLLPWTVDEPERLALLTAVAEFTANRAQSQANSQGATEPLPVLELAYDNNMVARTLLIGTPPTGDFYIVVQATAPANMLSGVSYTLHGVANYSWGSNPAVLGALTTVTVNGVNYSTRTTSPGGNWSVRLNGLPEGSYNASITVYDGYLTGTANLELEVNPGPPTIDLRISRMGYESGTFRIQDETGYALTGEPVVLKALVRNDGNTGTGPFDVAFIGPEGDTICVSGPVILAAFSQVWVTATQPYTAAEGSQTLKAYADSGNVIEETNENNNDRSCILIGTDDLPDLRPFYYLHGQEFPWNYVSGLSFNPVHPLEYQPVTVNCDIYNSGTSALPDGATFEVSFKAGGEEFASNTIILDTDLVPGASIQTSAIWSGGSAGAVVFSFHADTENAIAEIDENNNSTSRTMMVYPMADSLRVIALTSAPWQPLPEAAVNFTATVRNFGGFPGGEGVPVEFFIGSTDPDDKIGETILNEDVMPFGGMRNVTLAWTAPEVAGNYPIFAKINDAIFQSTLSVTNSPAPNLQVFSEDIIATPLYPSYGDTVSVQANVRNTEGSAAVDFTVRFYEDIPTGGWAELGAPVSVALLEVGSQATIDATASLIANRAAYSIKVVLEPNPEQGDANESDNQATSSFLLADAPVADAGEDVEAIVGQTITLDGTGSSNAITFAWTLMSWPAGSAASLIGANTAQPQITPDVPGTYTIRLIVSDGTVMSLPDFVNICAIAAPELTTAEVTGVTAVSAVSGGEIGNDGGAPVTVRGVVWSAFQNPTVETNEGITYDGSGTGSWVSELVELTPETTYYVRAYATNNAGTGYGGEYSFTTHSDDCTPGWVPTSYYQFNMQVIGQIFLNGEPSDNPNHVLGAFVDGECRGIASPDPNLMGLVFLSVGSDLSSGETVEFMIWNADICEECPSGVSIVFENQQQIGSPGNPFPFECGQHELSLNFGAGYTWFSANIDPGSMMLNNLFEPLDPCEEDRILGQHSFATYYMGQWVGSLNAINPAMMYKMQLCVQHDMIIQGQPVANNPITLGAGYTWLGYLPQESIAINDALANITPTPSEDNRLLSQHAFAVWYQGQWVGSLTHLQPGKGYISQLSSQSILQYPLAGAKGGLPPQREITSPTGEQPLTNKQYSMMLLAQLELPDGSISLNDEDVVYAFAGDECRGMAIPMNEHNGAIFMSVGSDLAEGEEITFKVWLSEFGTLETIYETISFEALKKAGTMEQPVLLTLKGFTGTTEGIAGGIVIGEPFPNPFSEVTEIPYRLNETARVKLTIYNSHGQQLRAITDAAMPAGTHKAVIRRDGLPAGVYFYRMEVFSDGETVQKHGKIIIK